MEFSDIVPQANLVRMAPNSSFFLYYSSKKIYVKDCSVALTNIAVIPVTEPQPPTDLQISPNSELIASFFKDKSVALVYNTKGNIIAKMEDTQSGMSGLLWSPDSLQLLIFSDMLYKVNIYNLSDRSTAVIRSPKTYTSRGCAFSHNNKFMALLEKHDCKDTIGFYSVADWKMVNSVALDSFDATDIKWQEDDSHVIVWENPINYRVHAVCPFKGVVLKYQPYDYALGVKTVDLSHKSHFFTAIGSYDEKIRVLNSLTWKLIAELDCSSPALQSDATKIYKEEEGKGTNQLKLIDRNSYKIPISKALSDKAGNGIGLLEFSYDDSYLACRNDNMPNTVWIWNMLTLQVQSVINLNNQVRMLKWDHDENKLCIACGAEKVLFWRDGVILECSFQMENRKFNIQKFIWSRDRKKILLFDKAELIYADLVSQ